MMANVYVSTACVRGLGASLEEHIAAYRAGGLDAIELGWAPRPATNDLRGLLCRQRGARFLIHNYFPQPRDAFVLNLASANPEILARSMEMAGQALRLTADLGAPYYSVHAGFCAEFAPSSLGDSLGRPAMIPRDEALRIYRASIDRLATLAKELEVDLLIEPNVVEARNLVDGRNALLLLADADEIERFMCDLARPEVGILLDTGHTNVTMATLGASRDAFIERISPWIRGLHVHDNDGSADQHRAPAPTSWVMDLLRDPRFSRLPIVVEATFRDVRSLADYYAGLLTEIGIQ